MAGFTKRVLVVFRHYAKGKEIGAALERCGFLVDIVDKGIKPKAKSMIRMNSS
jgi:hypothetical protein